MPDLWRLVPTLQLFLVQITNLWCFLWCDGFRYFDCWYRCLDRWGSNPFVLKGDYLAIATLGVSEIIRILIVNGGTLTNGGAGILGLPTFTTWQLVYLFVITTIFTINFLRSPIGRSTLSVREDEIAKKRICWDQYDQVKVIAFVFGAITAAIAGSLQAGFIGSVEHLKGYFFSSSINMLDHCHFGGLGSNIKNGSSSHRLRYLNGTTSNYKCTYDHLLIGFDSRDDLPSRWSSWNMKFLKKLLSKKEAN